MKRSFLKVKERSRELENEKIQTKPKTNTKPKSKPKHLPFEIDEKTISKQIQTIFKLMKILFLEVRAGSRELENEKTNPNPKPTPSPNPNQSTYLLKLMKNPFQNKFKPYLN